MSGARWYLLHPVMVHFPIALLIAGGAARAAALSRRAPAWLEAASYWLLAAGALTAWAALGLGLLAEKLAPHVPPAWRVLEDHEEAAWWTAGWFTALSAFAFVVRGKAPDWRPGRALVLMAWAAGLGMLARTAYLGGELVYGYGMGVGTDQPSPSPLPAGEGKEESLQEPLEP